MAIKSGQIIHDAHGFVIDRIQTGGIGNLNIPEERVDELGNPRSVGRIRDIPDLSFDIESLDVSTEIEALTLFRDPTTTTDGDEFDFDDAVPMDILSPFKSANNAVDVVRGIVIPYLTLETVTYRFGNRDNATQQFTLRGDSVYYVDGVPYYEEFSGNGVTAVFSLANTALPYTERGETFHVLSACVIRANGTYRRLRHGDDYTDTTGALTLVDPTVAPVGSTIRVVYASVAAATYPATVHQGTSIKPAAIRGRDIDVYIGDNAATPTFERWTGVQSVEVTRQVNLDNDEEFGNYHYVAQDYDVPDVTGRITVRPADVTDLWDKIHQITGVAAGDVVGPNSVVDLPIEIRLSDPETGDTLKTLYVPDARFTLPGVQGRVQQKVEVPFNFASESGQLLVYAGDRP